MRLEEGLETAYGHRASAYGQFPCWAIHRAAAKCSARPSSLNNCQANSAAISSEELLSANRPRKHDAPSSRRCRCCWFFTQPRGRVWRKGGRFGQRSSNAKYGVILHDR